MWSLRCHLARPPREAAVSGKCQKLYHAVDAVGWRVAAMVAVPSLGWFQAQPIWDMSVRNTSTLSCRMPQMPNVEVTCAQRVPARKGNHPSLPSRFPSSFKMVAICWLAACSPIFAISAALVNSGIPKLVVSGSICTSAGCMPTEVMLKLCTA